MSSGKLSGLQSSGALPAGVTTDQLAQQLQSVSPQLAQTVQQATAPNTQSDPGTNTTNIAPMSNGQPGASASDMMAAMGKTMAVAPQINQVAGTVAPAESTSVAPVTPTLEAAVAPPSDITQSPTAQSSTTQAPPPPAPVAPPISMPAGAATVPAATKQAQPIAQPVQPVQAQQSGPRPGETYQDYQARISGKPVAGPTAPGAASGLSDSMRGIMLSAINGNPDSKRQLPQIQQMISQNGGSLSPAIDAKITDLYNKSQSGAVAPGTGYTATVAGQTRATQAVKPSGGSYWLNQINSGAINV